MTENQAGVALDARYIHLVHATSGGWETWSWDESLFAGAAGYYERGRLPYAPGLADVFARSLTLEGRGRLLDVGCGPGTVTLRLAPLFEAAVGLDPDPGMLACASPAAAGQGIGNVAWVRQRAEALPAGLGSFRAVTFAASFHWMDRPRVASAVATMLDPGGAVVQVDAPGYRTGELAAEARRGSLPFPLPPDDALDQLRREYLGSDRRAGQGIRNTSPGGEDQVFREAGFLPAQTVIVPDQRIIERTADDIVASVFSVSSTAPHLFGDRREDFERDMREILAQASPPGRFSVRLPDNILRIWRLPALPGGRNYDSTCCRKYPGGMPRWEGDAAGRLERAALELFDERGFDRTTVAQIARRAGLNERSFYRYYSDKREVLFGGGDELERRLAQALQDVPADIGPLDALLAALSDAAEVFRPRELLRIRERVINANPQLRERELIKVDAIHATLVSGLRARGADETTARIATDMTMSIWRVAAERCLHGDGSSFAAEVLDATRYLRQIAAGDPEVIR